jgi:AcrR family transcriptional regulator
LLAAFVDLMLSRGYPAVSAEDIARHANVARSTFYMHFRSREDILRRSLERPSLPLVSLVSGKASMETLVAMLVHFHEQRRLNRVVFEPPVRNIWCRMLACMIERELAPRSRRGRALLPPRLIARHLADMQIALIANWLALSPQLEPDAVAAALMAATHSNLSALSDNSSRQH